MTLATFWNQDHPLSNQANTLCDTLVPISGHCESLQGELLRASTRINYDWFNNGWGCNNWSGAVLFIENNLGKLPNHPNSVVLATLFNELDFVREYSHGEPCHLNYDSAACRAVTTIHEIVVQAILANPELIQNTDDMFNYQEEDYREMYEEEEEY